MSDIGVKVENFLMGAFYGSFFILDDGNVRAFLVSFITGVPAKFLLDKYGPPRLFMVKNYEGSINDYLKQRTPYFVAGLLVGEAVVNYLLNG